MVDVGVAERCIEVTKPLEQRARWRARWNRETRHRQALPGDARRLAPTPGGSREFQAPDDCARRAEPNDLVRSDDGRKVAGAALDVFVTEPLAADHKFRTLPSVILTPHLGASTAEAQESVGIEIAEQIADVLNGGVIRNAVNMPSMDANAVKVLGPYLDLGAKLGTLVQQIAPAQVASLRVTYWGKVIDLNPSR